jgi:hypothetical protein
MKISFGIITGGGKTSFINQIIDSIEEEKIPEYEIIVIGSFLTAREHTTAYEFPETITPLGWITKKKNLIAQMAKYDVLVLLHDYIRLEKGWYKGFLQFQEENPLWDLVMCQMCENNGSRAIDWMGLPNDPIYGNVLHPYDYCNPKGMYVPGNFFVVKRNFFLKHPLDERRLWCDGEDIEWSKRIFGGIDNTTWLRNILRIPMDLVVPDPVPPAVYKMNIHSKVVYLKDKPTPQSFREPYDLHSGDNSRPANYKKEDYVYMQKRKQSKIEPQIQQYISN